MRDLCISRWLVILTCPLAQAMIIDIVSEGLSWRGDCALPVGQREKTALPALHGADISSDTVETTTTTDAEQRKLVTSTDREFPGLFASSPTWTEFLIAFDGSKSDPLLRCCKVPNRRDAGSRSFLRDRIGRSAETPLPADVSLPWAGHGMASGRELRALPRWCDGLPRT